mmetsp:Transcript_24258/g.56219  ORF Transcript_24258/g.56219 Transcript_24258/m.56219 type:complete len:335 (+) Transcript_24258:32-1036(+)
MPGPHSGRGRNKAQSKASPLPPPARRPLFVSVAPGAGEQREAEGGGRVRGGLGQRVVLGQQPALVLDGAIKFGKCRAGWTVHRLGLALGVIVQSRLRVPSWRVQQRCNNLRGGFWGQVVGRLGLRDTSRRLWRCEEVRKGGGTLPVCGHRGRFTNLLSHPQPLSLSVALWLASGCGWWRSLRASQQQLNVLVHILNRGVESASPLLLRGKQVALLHNELLELFLQRTAALQTHLLLGHLAQHVLHQTDDLLLLRVGPGTVRRPRDSRRGPAPCTPQTVCSAQTLWDVEHVPGNLRLGQAQCVESVHGLSDCRGVRGPGTVRRRSRDANRRARRV